MMRHVLRSILLAAVATTACVTPRRDHLAPQPIATKMNVYRAEVIHVSILARPEQVVGFLADVHNWKSWAPWVRTVSKSSARDWMLDTDTGTMTLRFVEANSLGVLDHTVTLASGIKVDNSMRVLANGSGSELEMVVLQKPPATSDEFERDVQAVRDDFARIKKVLEAMPQR